MIPYFTWQTIQLGPLTIQMWGVFVALGFLVAAFVAGKFVRRRGGDAKIVHDLAALMVVTGLVGGRIGHVLFYDLAYYIDRPGEIFAVWEGGLSMFGGIILSVIVGVIYLRKKKVDVWQYADAVAFGMPLGIGIGRIGCFLIHDHPGTVTDFFLGVQYPDGLVHHDLGLYEAIFGFVLAIFFWLWEVGSRKSEVARLGPQPYSLLPTPYLPLFAVAYGAFRVIADPLRVIDTRYFGLTPGQYFGFALIALGVWIMLRRGMAKTATIRAENN